MPLLQRTRQRRHTAPALLAMVFYLLTAGIVPAGHMAAPLGSGTAFHLCPGDARSSLIIDALAAAAQVHESGHDHHAQHSEPTQHDTQPADHSQHHNGHGGHSEGVSESSAEPGCILGGTVGDLATTTASEAKYTGLRAATAWQFVPHDYRRATWLRPPPRSPPRVLPA